MTHCQGKLRAIVLFVNPGKFDDAWVHSGLWQEAVGIPAVEVRVDPNGHDAKLLGAISSGQALLFDQNNKLVFNGGITESRGHFGANPGSDSVIAWVNSKVCPAKTTPVFGCELLDPINCAKNVANR